MSSFPSNMPDRLVDGLRRRIDHAFGPTLGQAPNPSDHRWPGEWELWGFIDKADDPRQRLAAKEALSDIRLLTDEARAFVTPILMTTPFAGSDDYGAPAEQFLLMDGLAEWLGIYTYEQLHCIAYYLLMPAFLGNATRRDLWLETLWDLGATVRFKVDVPDAARAVEF